MAISEDLLYTRIIGNDGRIEKQETFLGALLATLVLAVGIVAIVFLASFL